MKTCSSCKTPKSVDQFYRNKRKRDGVHGECKQCMNAAHNRRARAKQKRGARVWPSDCLSIRERLALKSKTNPSGCIEWTGTLSHGYGVLGLMGKNYYAHRLVYEIKYGPVLGDLFVLHSCDNPKCINPKHLSLGTQKDNMADVAKRRRSPHLKFSDECVRQIRDLVGKGLRHSEIAAITGASRSTVSAIATGRNRKYVA